MVKFKIRSVLVARILVAATVVIAGAFGFYRNSFVNKRQLTPNTGSTNGLVFYDRLRTNSENYLLVNFMGFEPPTCNIMDYEGNIVHQFPEGHCAFSQDGGFYHFSEGIRKFDLEGKEVWKIKGYGHHHSTHFSDESKELFLIGREALSDEVGVDTVVGISSEGKETFFWRSDDHIEEISAIVGYSIQNPYPSLNIPFRITHFNSVQVIPPNASEISIPAFKSGNILVSCFLRSLLFIIDRDTRKIVWHKVLDVRPDHGAHVPKILPNGHIFMFLNKRDPENRTGNNFSSVNEYDPVADKFSWEYFGEPKTSFFSDLWSSAHVVGEDQFLATVAEKGTIVQINRQGRILWEWHSHSPVDKTHPTYEILPIYEVIPIDKKRVDPHIKQWKLMGGPIGT